MQQLNCLIIEDEPLAAELLSEYIEEIPFLKLKAICENAISAVELLQKENIDVLFLDLHLPKIKGFDFIRTLANPPQVIVTTAYHQYALEGYELNIVDYLLKPISLSRFIQAINKLNIHENQSKPPILDDNPKTKADHVYVPTNRSMTRINFCDILYIESLRQYIKIVTQEQTITTKLNIGDFESGLPEYLHRIHKSYIVSQHHIRSYNHKYVTLSNEQVLPIGATYKNQFLQHFSP